MRRVVAAVLLSFAGLIPLLRFHPDAESTAETTTAATGGAAAPVPAGGNTVDGSTVDTQFGPYQVRAVFDGNTITDVQIITTPSDRRSRRIASGAAPTLRTEALRAQSAHIDTVSGATITSEAYARSLQAAIDAHRG